MDYDKFKEILYRHICGGTLEEELLTRLTKHPERFVGLFRPSTPRDKIFQNLIQAREINFGTAMEEVIRQILICSGYRYVNSPSEKLDYDHLCFDQTETRLIVIEQKIRDDHDSTKRRGQFDNFRKKIEAILNLEEYRDKEIHFLFYFLDPDFKKNQEFYQNRISKTEKEIHENYGIHIRVSLRYGEGLFSYLSQVHQLVVSWNELLDWLKTWKRSLSSITEKLDVSGDTIEHIAVNSPSLILKLADHEKLWEEGIIRELFSGREILERACKVLSDAQVNSRNRKKLAKLKEMIERYYGGGL